MGIPIINEEQLPCVTEHGRHLLLSAGAGSGKTHVLVERYMRILEDSGWDLALPARILAITFTEKAALQMRGRILAGLAARTREAPSLELKSRLTDLGREMENAPISTIHGFCSRLLRENAVEAGLDPQFSVPGEVDLYDLKQGILDALLRDEDSDLRLLAGEFGVSALGDALDELWSLRRSLGLPWHELADGGAEALALRLRESARAERRGILARWLAALPERLAELTATFPEGRHPIAQSAAKLEEARAILSAAEPLGADPRLLTRVLEVLKGLRSSGRGIPPDEGRLKRHWEKLKSEMEERAQAMASACALGSDAGVEDPGAMASARPADLDLAFWRLLARYAARLHEEMRARGWLDFEDLQLEAVRILEENATVLSRIRDPLRHVLVDELQDTNQLQLKLIRLLVPEPTDASRRALFLVGDPRQSIYAFRNADLEVFRREKERMTARGEARELVRNHRSHPSLVKFFNDFFDGEEFPGMDPRRPGDDAEPRVFVQLTAQPKGVLSRAEARLAAARTLARSLKEAREGGLAVEEEREGALIRRPMEWKDAAILVRSSSGIAPLAKALAEAGIPYEAAGGREYFLRQELRDLEDLIAALDDPYHRLKLARALRGDLVGLSTADLLVLLPPVTGPGRRDRDRGELIARLEQALGGELPLSEDGKRRLGRFMSLHRRFSGRFRRLPLGGLVEELVEASDFDLKAAADRHALKILRNLRQLSELLAEMESSRRLGIREFLDTMERVREVSPRREEAWVPEEGESLLRILTIHSAKGLEFPLVVIADLDRELRPGSHVGKLPCLRADFASARSEALLGIQWQDPEDERISDDAYEWIREAQRAREEAENRRLFYVAMTRARDYLLLSGVLPDTAPDQARARLFNAFGDGRKSFLDQLSARLGAGLETERCEFQLSGEGRLSGRQAPRVASARRAPRPAPDWSALDLPPADLPALELPVTSLALLAACPLRWLLERRLGLTHLYEEHGEAWIPETQGEGGPGGAAFGAILHGILERWDFRAEASAAFAAACPADLDPSRREEAERILTGFFDPRQAWVRRLREAEEIRREEPFVLDLGQVRLTGQVDLVFTWQGQRVLLDWKSDRVDGAAGIARRLEHHRFQLALYALALREAGLPVDQTLIAFLRAGALHEVEIDARRLEDAAKRARDLGVQAARLSRLGTRADAMGLPRPQDPPCSACPFLDGPCPPAYRQAP